MSHFSKCVWGVVVILLALSYLVSHRERSATKSRLRMLTKLINKPIVSIYPSISTHTREL